MFNCTSVLLEAWTNSYVDDKFQEQLASFAGSHGGRVCAKPRSPDVPDTLERAEWAPGLLAFSWETFLVVSCAAERCKLLFCRCLSQ